jgi:hypothetical protein
MWPDLGIIAFFFLIGLAVMTAGLGAIPLILLLVIDGFLCAERYNKRLVETVIKERERAG